MKPNYLFLFVLFLCFTIFFPLNVNASERTRYMAIKGGMYSPTDDLEDLDQGFNGEVAFGGYVSERFALEGGIGYFSTDGTFNGYNTILGNWSEKDEVTVMPITFTAKGIVPAGSGEFYIGGGLGIYFTNADSTIDSTVTGQISFEDNTTVIGAHFLIGGDINISEKVFIGVEGKYIITEDAKVSDSYMGSPIELEFNLNGYTISAILGFRF